jgi:hypothetical protein
MSAYPPLLCKNCKYVTPSPMSEEPELSRCSFGHPLSLVTGNPIPVKDLPYAAVERHRAGRCGPAGSAYLPIVDSIPFITREETQELLAGDPSHV